METAMGDFIPATYPYAIELQNLVAVLECTSKEMIPKEFRSFSRDQIIQSIQKCKALLGR
jgi:hypothetical protein